MSEGQQNVIKALILAAFLIGTLALVRLSSLGEYLGVSRIDLWQHKLAEFRGWAPLVFTLGGAVFISLGTPRSLVSTLGGVVFGLFGGVALALAAALLGSVSIFLLTKWLGRPLFQQRVGDYLKPLESGLKTNGFLTVVLLRQLPLTCVFVNVLIGLTSVSLGTFLWGSVVGLLPETIVFALYGSSLRESFVLRVSLASCLLVLLALAIRHYYRNSALARDLSRRLTKHRP